jgi:hypothetical protein
LADESVEEGMLRRDGDDGQRARRRQDEAERWVEEVAGNRGRKASRQDGDGGWRARRCRREAERAGGGCEVETVTGGRGAVARV